LELVIISYNQLLVMVASDLIIFYV